MNIKDLKQHKIEETKQKLLYWQTELKNREEELKAKAKIIGIKNWLGFTFKSSSQLTDEFKLFDREIKSYIKKQLNADLELVNWNKGHFYFSGFIKNKLTDKLIYFSCSDVRHFPNSWYNNLLIRTAENEKDYTGGSNNYCKITDITKKTLFLTL